MKNGIDKEEYLDKQVEKIAAMVNHGSIKLVNKLVKLGRILSIRSKFYSDAHRIGSILSDMSESDKNEVITRARKLRIKWRKI